MMCFSVVRCDPHEIDFKRSSGQLKITTRWERNIKKYYLQYRESNATQWIQVKAQVL